MIRLSSCISQAGLQFAVLCTRLRSVSIFLFEYCLEVYLEVLLSRVGAALCELTVTLSPNNAVEAQNERMRNLFPVAAYARSLESLETDVLCCVSLEPVAVANPLLRRLKNFVCNNSKQNFGRQPSDVEKWVREIVNDFITNCSQLTDIVIEKNALMPKKKF